MFISILFSSFVLADGKKIAATCAACHGEKGIGETPVWPNLAGQKKEYLVKQLKDFKAEIRKDSSMNAMAKALSDKEIEEVSEYFSKMKCK